MKNNTSDGANLQKEGSPAGVAATGEADQYGAFRVMLRSIGCSVADAKPATYKDITIVPGPQTVLKPDFVCCPAEYKRAFPTPNKVNISANSSLVVKGTGIVIESLDLDGALEIECEEGAIGVIRDLKVTNGGWSLSPVASTENEVFAMRGYTIDKRESKRIVFKKDGTIEGDYDPDATTKSSTEGKDGASTVAPVAAPAKQTQTATTAARKTETTPAEPATPVCASRDAPELNQPASGEAIRKAEDACPCSIM